MNIISKERYLELQPKAYAITINRTYDFRLHADAVGSSRINEYGWWLKKGLDKTLIEILEIAKAEPYGDINSFYCEDTHSRMFFYFYDLPTIIYFENNEETRNLLPVLRPGSYIFAIDDNDGVNEYDNPEERSREFTEYQKTMSEIGVQDIVRIVNRLSTISPMVSTDPDWENDTNEVIYPFRKVIKELITDDVCPKCGKKLFKSDLPQYTHLCIECDENF